MGNLIQKVVFFSQNKNFDQIKKDKTKKAKIISKRQVVMRSCMLSFLLGNVEET
jgi:hypothetical protein